MGDEVLSLMSEFPKEFSLARYEVLAINPMIEVSKLLENLDIDFKLSSEEKIRTRMTVACIETQCTKSTDGNRNFLPRSSRRLRTSAWRPSASKRSVTGARGGIV